MTTVITQHTEPLTVDDHDDTPLILVAALLGTALSLVIDMLPVVPVLGDHPFNEVLFPVAVSVAFAVALAGYRGPTRHAGLLERLAVACGVAYVAFLLSCITSLLLDDVFIGLHVEPWAAHTLTGVYAAVIAHVVVDTVRVLTLKGLLQLLVVVLGGGFLLSMIAVRSPDWWRDSLSWMGYDAASGYVFNSTLIVTGMVMGAYAAVLLRLVDADLARRLRPYLAVMALGTACIGLFPMRVSWWSQSLHDLSAFIALTAFLGFALMLARHSGFTRRFRGRCMAGVVGIWVMGGLYLLQIANYTFTELAILGVIAYLLSRLDREIRLMMRAYNPPRHNTATENTYSYQMYTEFDEQ